MTEIETVAGDSAYCRRHLGRWSRPRRVHTPMIAQPARSWLMPEPLGWC